MSEKEKQEHRWVKLKNRGGTVCQRCDLLALRNEATEKRIKKPCIGQSIKVEMPEFMKQKM